MDKINVNGKEASPVYNYLKVGTEVHQLRDIIVPSMHPGYKGPMQLHLDSEQVQSGKTGGIKWNFTKVRAHLFMYMFVMRCTISAHLAAL